MNGSSRACDAALPATFTVGEPFIAHNNAIRTNIVRVTNANYTIRGAVDTLAPGDNLILEPGDTVSIAVISASILEIV